MLLFSSFLYELVAFEAHCMQCSLDLNSMDKLYGITDSITLFYVLPCLTYDNKTRNDHVEEKK